VWRARKDVVGSVPGRHDLSTKTGKAQGRGRSTSTISQGLEGVNQRGRESKSMHAISVSRAGL